MFTFTHYNKLTSRIVNKPLIGLTTLNQTLIHTPIPNLMGVIWSESMISQAFQACYSVEGCLSDHCILSLERIEYMVGNIHQLNLSPRSPLIHSRELHLQPQGLLRWRKGPRRLSLSISTLRNILEYYKCWRLNSKETKKEILYFTTFPCVSPSWHCHAAIINVTFLSFIPSGHDHVILLHFYTSLLPDISQSLTWLSSTLNIV